MALTNMVSILEDARKNKYAIPAFDVSNMEMIRAVAEVCEEERSPAIFMLLKADLQGMSLEMLVAMIKAAAEKMTVPVCIHLDHAVELELIQKVIKAGATSVMYDGSTLSFDENVKNTKAVVDYAHPFGVSVEAELGHVADAIGGLSETGESSSSDEDIEKSLTNPNDARLFVEKTGVDCLAVAIGTAHGVYVSTPTLHFDLLGRIAETCPCPLVLHGGSGTPDKDVQKAIRQGIAKINIYSEVLAAMNTKLKEKYNSIENLSAWPSIIWEPARKAMRDVIRNKIRVFGSDRRA